MKYKYNVLEQKREVLGVGRKGGGGRGGKASGSEEI